jgi:hypothetical protein
VADFVYGFVVYGNLLTGSFAAQPGIYRTAADQVAYMPVGAAGIFLAMIAAVLLFARGNHPRGVGGGITFGLLLGIFAIGVAVLVNYATLNIRGDRAARMVVAAAGEWLVVGAVSGAVYGTGPRPAA